VRSNELDYKIEEAPCKQCGKMYSRWKLNYSQICYKCEDENIPYNNSKECRTSNLLSRPFIYIGELALRILSK
jgi:hypothetical protein